MASRVLYLDAGGVTEYLGNYDDFLSRRTAEEQKLSLRSAPAEPAATRGRKQQRRIEAQRRQQLQREIGPLRLRVEELEAAVARAEEELGRAEAELADPGTYSVPQRAADLARLRSELEDRVLDLSAQWETTATELERREQEVKDSWQDGDGAA